MYCTLMLSHSCTAALFLCNPWYGFINDKVKEKSVLLTSCVVWKGDLSGLQWVKRGLTQAPDMWWASGMPVADDSPQILPGLPYHPGLGSAYNEFFIWTVLARRQTHIKMV